MTIENIPEIIYKDSKTSQGLFVHDFKMTNDAIKIKVNLSMHMFSSLQVGKRQYILLIILKAPLKAKEVFMPLNNY